MDGGLFTLQQLSTIIIFTCLNDKGKNKSSEKAQIKLESDDVYLEDLVNVLREAALHMYDKKIKTDTDDQGQGEFEGEGRKEGQDDPVISDAAGEDRERDEDRVKQRQLFVDWTVAAGSLYVSRQTDSSDVDEGETGDGS